MKSVLLNTVLTASINVAPITDSISNFGEILAGFAIPICVLMIIIAGLALMTGQQGRQWAKPTFLWSAIGLVVVMFASTIVDALGSSLVAV